MPNFLNLVCPRCGADDRVEIASHLWLRVTKTGTRADLTGTMNTTRTVRPSAPIADLSGPCAGSSRRARNREPPHEKRAVSPDGF